MRLRGHQLHHERHDADSHNWSARHRLGRELRSYSAFRANGEGGSIHRSIWIANNQRRVRILMRARSLFLALLTWAVLSASAFAQTPSGAVSRQQMISDIGTDFPTNGQGLITAAELRAFLIELVNSTLFSLSNLADIPGGPNSANCVFQTNGSMVAVCLNTIPGSIGSQPPVTCTTATCTVTSTQGDELVNYLTGAVTVNMPAASSRISSSASGPPITIKDMGCVASTNPITIIPNGADAIDGYTAGAGGVGLYANCASLSLVPISGGWYIQ
jgi:hypothetical protein